MACRYQYSSGLPEQSSLTHCHHTATSRCGINVSLSIPLRKRRSHTHPRCWRRRCQSQGSHKEEDGDQEQGAAQRQATLLIRTRAGGFGLFLDHDMREVSFRLCRSDPGDLLDLLFAQIGSLKGSELFPQAIGFCRGTARASGKLSVRSKGLTIGPRLT